MYSLNSVHSIFLYLFIIVSPFSDGCNRQSDFYEVCFFMSSRTSIHKYSVSETVRLCSMLVLAAAIVRYSLSSTGIFRLRRVSGTPSLFTSCMRLIRLIHFVRTVHYLCSVCLMCLLQSDQIQMFLPLLRLSCFYVPFLITSLYNPISLIS